jgi:hypothetical protein
MVMSVYLTVRLSHKLGAGLGVARVRDVDVRDAGEEVRVDRDALDDLAALGVLVLR